MSCLAIGWFIVGVVLMTIDAYQGDYGGAAAMLAMATVGALLLEYIIRTWRRFL